MKYKDLNKTINKKINKNNIFTRDDIIDYCKTLDSFNNMDLFCNGLIINNVSIDIVNNRIDFSF